MIVYGAICFVVIIFLVCMLIGLFRELTKVIENVNPYNPGN